MKKIAFLGTVLAGLLSAGQVMAASNSLENATVTGNYMGAANTLVGADWLLNVSGAIENVTKLDPTGYVSEFWTNDLALAVDFTQSGFVTFAVNTANLPTAPYTFTFDFAGLNNETITGFSVVDSSSIGGAPILSVLNSHAVSVDLSNVSWGVDYTNFTAQMNFAAAVPEPAPTAMLLAGLGVLGLIRRNKQFN